MCGGGPVLALLLYARKLGEAKVAVLSTGDSTAAGGPADQVVGYMSAAVYLEEKSQALNFSQEEKRIVDPGQKIYRTLSEKWRVFNLRNFEFKISGEKGCLCYPERKRGASRLYWFVEPVYPLSQAVIQCAVYAAVQDPRFPPVKLSE